MNPSNLLHRSLSRILENAGNTEIGLPNWKQFSYHPTCKLV